MVVATTAPAAAAESGILNLAWLIPALPFVAFFVILFFGKKMRNKGAEVGIAAVAISFIMSIPVFFQTIANVHGEEGAFERSVTWFEFGAGKAVELGMRIDGLTAVMLLVVTFVSLMVHIYSTAYMAGEVRFTFFYAALALFTGSMLNLVLANNLLQLLVGWEGVGICSYLLIGHFWEEKANSDAANKAFLTTRLGDIGLMFGIFTLFFATGTFNIRQITTEVGQGGLNTGLLTVAALLIFAGAIGKSAQVPLHVWLPDAMAGPTPVSALIHAATMVVAGVYLIARMFTLFDASPTALGAVAVIGGITMVIAAALALVQQDLKRVLAYSTISQLAYMVGALGVGAYAGGVFHIWTHAWFKALLFLGAGSVIHAVHSNNMTDMGGLKDKMPITFRTYMIGSLALAGFPPLAGFFSKDEMILGAYEAGTHGSAAAMFTFFAMLLTAFLTAAYVARMLALTFFGKSKYDEAHVHPHESPPAMTAPLVMLAILTIVGGWVGLPGELNLFGHWLPREHEAHFSPTIAIATTVLAAAGFALSWAIFARRKIKVDLLRTPFAWFYRLLQNKYYLDDIYMGGIVRPIRDQLSRFAYWTNQRILDAMVNGSALGTVALGRAAYRGLDQQVIDGAVNGLGLLTRASGSRLKFWQAGNVQIYAAALFLGIAGFVGAFILFRP